MEKCGELVSDSLKARFAEWVDRRTRQGVLKYGRPLQTYDGRHSEMDMMEELLDFAQYQHRRLMEVTAERDALAARAAPPGALE